MAAMPVQAAPAPAQEPVPQSATSVTDGAQSSFPGTSGAKASAPQGSKAAAKSTQMAMAAPSAPAGAQTVLLPATPPPPIPTLALTGMDAIRAYIPTEGISPPLPPVTGTPDANAAPPIPAGTHLEDGLISKERPGFPGLSREAIFGCESWSRAAK